MRLIAIQCLALILLVGTGTSDAENLRERNVGDDAVGTGRSSDMLNRTQQRHWSEEPHGSYKWCASHASVPLDFDEWDQLCGDTVMGLTQQEQHAARRLRTVFGRRHLKSSNAQANSQGQGQGQANSQGQAQDRDPFTGRPFSEISAELTLQVETASPGFWGNWTAGAGMAIMPDASWEQSPPGSYHWCQSAASYRLDDDEWEQVCGSVQEPPNRQRALAKKVRTKYHYHAIATNGPTQWVIPHYRISSGKQMYTQTSVQENLQMLTCNKKCERSNSNRPFMKRGSGVEQNGLLVSTVGPSTTEESIHMHSIAEGVMVAVTGTLIDGKMVGTQLECGGSEVTPEWNFVWNTNTEGRRCAKWVKFNNLGRRRYQNVLCDTATYTQTDEPCWDRDCARRHVDCPSDGCKDGSEPSCLG